MAVGPRSGGRLWIAFGPDAFDEFFDELTADLVPQALGPEPDKAYQGDQLAAMVKSVEDFLKRLNEQRDKSPPAAGHAFVQNEKRNPANAAPLRPFANEICVQIEAKTSA